MAGVPAHITLSPAYNAQDQLAALMFSANRQISHSPPSTWVDYSAAGAEAARNSNICYGFTGDPGCVMAYIVDDGSNNSAVGHRRWMLYPQTQTMGTGDVPGSGPASNPYPTANALWVFDGLFGATRPATRDVFVSWPPPGFVPYQVVGPRWSFSYPGADFTHATVVLRRGALTVPVRLEALDTGYGDSTIVWVPDNLDANAYFQPVPPESDITSSVTISNAVINGVPKSFSYSVTVFDPDPGPGANFAFLPASSPIGRNGGSGATSFIVTPPATTWTADSAADWLTLNPVSGTGSASIAWSASLNLSSRPRTALLRAGTVNFTVVQDGAACSYALSSSSGTLPASGGSGSFSAISTPDDCSFGGYSYTGAIAVSSAFTAPGVLTFNYTAPPNASGGLKSFTIQIAGQSFTVNQSSQPVPSLSIAKTHSGVFIQGQTGATYTVTVSNAPGAAATSGFVTVTEVIPPGLTLVSMAGSGWACPLGTICTRSDLLNGGASYPPIAVTVNVAPAAPSTVTNSVTVSGGGSGNASASDVAAIVGTSSPLQFVPVTPCRVLDTRSAIGPLGGPYIAAQTTRNISVPYGACGVPANASAYSLNVTVVPRTGTLGYLTLWPAGQPQPLVSTLNSYDGSVLANAAIVPSGAAGSISAYATNDTELIIDINGYFVPPAFGTLQFYPVAPCRVLDTRYGSGTLSGPSLAAGNARSFPMSSSSCRVPAGAAAYSLNVTVAPQGPLAYLSAWPTGQPQPVVSTLNSNDGRVLANAAIVPAGAGGAVTFFATNQTDLIVDINGYFAAPGAGGLNFYTANPCRILDTRSAAGVFGGPLMSAGTSRAFPLPAAACAIPASAAAYALNVTAVPTGVLAYLSLWPGGQAQPFVSTLNAVRGLVVANAALVPAGTNGSVSVYVTDPSHVIIDVNGYFGP